jgi:hypothetical protein
MNDVLTVLHDYVVTNPGFYLPKKQQLKERILRQGYQLTSKFDSDEVISLLPNLFTYDSCTIFQYDIRAITECLIKRNGFECSHQNTDFGKDLNIYTKFQKTQSGFIQVMFKISITENMVKLGC